MAPFPCLFVCNIVVHETEKVVSKYLAPPGRLADLLAIAGDRSDGIVGADGYGPVKAAKVRQLRLRPLLACLIPRRIL